MFAHRHIFTVLGLRTGFVVANGGRMFAVRHHEHRCITENQLERIRVIYQHVARRRAHERLNATSFARFKRG